MYPHSIYFHNIEIIILRLDIDMWHIFFANINMIDNNKERVNAKYHTFGKKLKKYK